VLDRLGAIAVLPLARARLRDLGATSVPRGRARSTRRNPGGLTDRQLEVVRLLTSGLSNAEIARRLVLSPKTVEHHVGAVLTKLGAATRAEAADAARRLGMVDAP
jgi:DNA-binding NarL/FixJ family response regulator